MVINKWLPIDTAPKDGTKILGAVAPWITKAGHKMGGDMEIIFWMGDKNDGNWRTQKGRDLYFPTVWQCLPSLELEDEDE